MATTRVHQNSQPSKLVQERPLTPRECGEAGIMARLINENWDAMTAAARKSPNHVSSMDRWRKQAGELNPHLTPDQAERLAEKLRHAHYVRMGQLSAKARKLARSASAILADIDQADMGAA